jgi:hypothetical protein
MSQGSYVYAPSIDWGIQVILTAGGGAILTLEGLEFLLLNVRAQVYYKASLKYYGFGGGLPVGVTVSNPAWTFFRTSEPLTYDAFQGKASIATAEFTVIYGGSLAYLTFWGVDHDPYWLDLGGVTLGLSGGVTFGPIVGVEIFPDPIRVIGTPITPA